MCKRWIYALSPYSIHYTQQNMHKVHATFTHVLYLNSFVSQQLVTEVQNTLVKIPLV